VNGGTTPAGTNDDGVTKSTITLTMPSLSTYANNNYGGNPTGAELLFTPFVYSESGSPYTLTLNNVPAGAYNLYLYNMNGSGNGASTKDTVNGISITNTYNSYATTFVKGTDYGVITNIVLASAGSISISVAPSGLGSGQPTEADFNGLQLVGTNVAGGLSVTKPAPAMPALSIQPASGSQGLTLQWPGNDGGNISDATPQPNLYFTPSLAAPVVWTQVTNAPVLSNGQWTVSLPTGTNGSGFYQLQTNTYQPQ